MTTTKLGSEPPEAKALLDARRASAFLGMAVSSFRARVAEGAAPPPAFSTGRTVLWSSLELTAWATCGCPPAKEWGAEWKKLRRELLRG